MTALTEDHCGALKTVNATCSACGHPKRCYAYKHIKVCAECLEGLEELFADIKAKEASR